MLLIFTVPESSKNPPSATLQSNRSEFFVTRAPHCQVLNRAALVKSLVSRPHPTCFFRSVACLFERFVGFS